MFLSRSFRALFAGLALLFGSSAAIAQAEARPAPLRHDMRITIPAGKPEIEVHDIIEIPAGRFERGQVTLELADFIKPRFRLVEGSQRLRISSRPGDFGRLWQLSAPPAPASRNVKIEVSYRIVQPKSAQIAIEPRHAFAGSSGDAWYPQIEYSQQEVGRLRFNVPPGQTVIATGSLVSSQADTAAGRFEFEAGKPVKFAFAAGAYRKFTEPSGRFSIYALEDRPGLQDIAQATGKLLAFLEGMYGSFPYGPPALVEVDFPTIVAGASEAGFILADDSQFTNQSVLYWTHEFAHQWWGNFVRARPDSAAKILFTEGMAEFSALMAIEASGGRSALRNLRLGRTTDDSPISRYGRLSSGGLDCPLQNWKPANGDGILAMHRLATSKAAHVLMMLRDEVGNEAITAGLRGLIAQSTGGYASWVELEAALANASGRDLSSYFEQWLGRPGIANLGVTWSQDGDKGAVSGTVTQSGQNYSLSLEIGLLGYGGKRKVEKLPIDGSSTEFRFTPGFHIVSVELDPDYRILRWPLPSDLR